MSVRFSPSFRTCAPLAGPGVYCSRSVTFFSLARTVPGGTHGTHEEVPPGAASRENPTSGVRSVCDRPTAVAGRRGNGGGPPFRFYWGGRRDGKKDHHEIKKRGGEQRVHHRGKDP